ncbi:MAG: phosphate ABC transporter permease subunit PstC [Desulfobacterota bacterium]|nr:phosphate ABC transporter permease subunit PstC [Thermodesulfobacteriota bacterium]MDW8001393.1 phosphate ABC transporter permease subunit PstC [Deltaproteobacteria bacterium]
MRNFRSVKAPSRIKEKAIVASLFFCAAFSVFVTISIVVILFYDSYGFFRKVSIKEFLTGTQWTPLFAEPKFGVLPLVAGTFLTTTIALMVALPVGLITAIYLSEYAPAKLREALKPILELLAAVPTVVYGYFALLFVTPLLQKFIPDLSGFNALSPGIIMGIMIVPYVSSVSEDAMRAVPMSIREGSYAMGATRLQTAIRVVVPAAFSGIAAAFIMGISRAIGETMVVAIAAGMMPNWTINPLEPVQTFTSYIVQVSLGDVPHGTLEYSTIFAVGLVLFIITLAANVVSFFLKMKFMERY